jgi:hypothetical protein
VNDNDNGLESVGMCPEYEYITVPEPRASLFQLLQYSVCPLPDDTIYASSSTWSTGGVDILNETPS